MHQKWSKEASDEWVIKDKSSPCFATFQPPPEPQQPFAELPPSEPVIEQPLEQPTVEQHEPEQSLVPKEIEELPAEESQTAQ